MTVERSTALQTLGLPASASTKEIRTAYRCLARRLHPDVAGPGEATAESFRRVVSAYEHLVEEDEESRRTADRIREAWAELARYRERTRIKWRAKMRARWKLVAESMEIKSVAAAVVFGSTSQILADLFY